MIKRISTLLFIILISIIPLSSQGLKWVKNSATYMRQEGGDIVQYTAPSMDKKVIVTKKQLTPQGQSKALNIRNYFFSDDNKKVLIYTNTKKVWRQDTKGDYWVLDIATNKLMQLGKNRPASSLMFAKFSPDGNKVAYVSERNIYIEDVNTNQNKVLTSTNGTPKLINGTFDWVYEEEFDCRDGFRWSPDGKKIAFWQIDANKIRDFYMVNTTDSIYPFIVPVEYPKVGEYPSPYKIGVVDIQTDKTQWMNIPGNPSNTYVPRMEWANNSQQLMIQYLNRKQNNSQIMLCDATSGSVSKIYEENDEAWVDLMGTPPESYWIWVNNGKEFLWTSEKDGWRHIYRITKDGKETLITKGNYDIIKIVRVDDANGYIYFTASSDNATQIYLYRVKISGDGDKELLSPASQKGSHSYDIAPNGKYAQHSFQNYYTEPMREWVSLPNHKSIIDSLAIEPKLKQSPAADNNIEYFQVTTTEGVTMDGWLAKPKDFDPKKKYPIVFSVYTEPAGASVADAFGYTDNYLYAGNMYEDGYIHACIDGRGTPYPKGRAWRKAIYRKIGVVNIRDQALGAQEMFKRWSWIDTSRVAVYGWSGGGSTTLNLLFQYPDIYKTGIAVAAVGNQLTYDNIYQERYMGIPQENKSDFIKGSPITHAKNLRGNLLYIHGTGDDNVHYQNAEMLVNELIKHNKYFQFMPYPNRTHSISEGEGTTEHLMMLYTKFLRTHCPPGGR
jgi:dipeptidyl-peptidase 4